MAKHTLHQPLEYSHEWKQLWEQQQIVYSVGTLALSRMKVDCDNSWTAWRAHEANMIRQSRDQLSMSTNSNRETCEVFQNMYFGTDGMYFQQ